MSNKHFELYKSFNHLEEAKVFADFLNENNIENSLETIGNVFDTSITGKAAISNYLIKLDPQNFEVVNEILRASAKDLSQEDLEKHHLNLLDDNELKAIFVKPDEWATEDTEIARQLLKLRGFSINESEIDRLKNERLSKIREGKDGNPFYLFMTFLAIILGLGLFLAVPPGGIGMAYYYSYGKNIDHTGHSHFAYNESTRQSGKLILFLGLTIFIIEIIFLFAIMNYTIGDIYFYN